VIKFKNTMDKTLFFREIGKNTGEAITNEDLLLLRTKRADRIKLLHSKVTDYRAVQLLQTSCENKVFNGHVINYVAGHDVDKITLLIALSSIRTHLLIEMQYYVDVLTEISLANFYEQADNLLYEIAQAIQSDIKFIDLLPDCKALLIAVANKHGLATRIAEKLHLEAESAQTILNSCLSEYNANIEQSFLTYDIAFSSFLKILEQKQVSLDNVDVISSDKHN
jgi:hypothetical protein